MPDGAGVLLADRKAPLLSRFKAVYVCLGPGPRPALSALDRWLAFFMAWYRDRVGQATVAGVFPNHFFGPSVTFLGPAPVRCADDLAALFRACRRAGLAPHIGVDAIEAAGAAARIMRLAQAGLAQADLHLNRRPDKAEAGAARALMLDLQCASVKLRLFGDSVDWLSTGALDLEALNSDFISIYPLAERIVTPRSARPCAQRFGVWIDPDGDIYPCAGLMGVDAFRIGRVADAEGGSAPLDLSRIDGIGQWAKCGPSLPEGEVHEAPPGETGRPLPLICRRHRALELARRDAGVAAADAVMGGRARQVSSPE